MEGEEMNKNINGKYLNIILLFGKVLKSNNHENFHLMFQGLVAISRLPS